MKFIIIVLFLAQSLVVLYGKDPCKNDVSIPETTEKNIVCCPRPMDKYGNLFYKDSFRYVTFSASTRIQETNCWKYVKKNDIAETDYALKVDYFVVNSKTPLEYTLQGTLLEHTRYRYTLCCNVKGEGKITLSTKNGKTKKDFLIDSKQFETITYELGDGLSLNTPIIPSITMQGYLQFESITLYQKEINDQWTVCLGSIEDISDVPDIKKANYPDCYYTAKFVVKDILNGKPLPRTIQLLIPAFLDKKINPLSQLMKKGNWFISIRPFSLATPKEQEIEQVDDIETGLYSPYILNAASTSIWIDDHTASGIPILEGTTYLSPFDRSVNQPLEKKFIDDSKNERQKELIKVNKIIGKVDNKEEINKKFQAAWDKKQKVYCSLNDDWIWAKEQHSFFALPKNWTLIPSVQIPPKNIEAIAELNRFFLSQGILFIVQIVPDYRDIAALILNPEFQKYGDQRSARIAQKLLEQGVEVQYISDEFVKNALNYERMFFYPFDSHPDEGAVTIMTSLMANRLKKFSDILPRDLDPNILSKENRNTGYKRDLIWPHNVDIGSHKAGEPVQVPYILYNKKIMDQNPRSKVLVFGNSFTQEPMTSNAYISYLAPKIQHICSCYAAGGEGAVNVLPRLFLMSPEKYLKGKKIAVLPLSVTYFTDSSFANISAIDATLKKLSRSQFLTDLPLKKNEGAILPPSYPFPFMSVYIPLQTSCTVLSNNREQISLSIPQGINARHARITLQPLIGYNISILIKGKTYCL